MWFISKNTYVQLSITSQNAIFNRCSLLHTSTRAQKNKSSSKRWLDRQMRDPFVKEAKARQYRARSAFKLLEIDKRFHILRPGDYVVDCGAAPGSWSQVAADKVNSLPHDSSKPQGKVIAIDILEFEPIPGVRTLSMCDFLEELNQSRIISYLGHKMADCVISDMAPNATGIKDMDHERIMMLANSALKFAEKVLKHDGMFLCKIWDGHMSGNLKNRLGNLFNNCRIVRPEASRKESAEVFLLARGYRSKGLV